MPGKYGFHGYGAAAASELPVKATPTGFMLGDRRRLNVIPICLNLFLPWLLFSSEYAVMSFSIHYHSPQLANMYCIFGGVVVLISGLLGWVAFNKKVKNIENRDPTWYIYGFVALLIAWILGMVFGSINFTYHMQPYYDVLNLSSYPSVNPAREKGQQLMDGGRVYFTEGSALDLTKSMSFKNLDLYCVAPIVNTKEPLASYDFWAVGMNCCSSSSSSFRCGEFNNPHARSGLRLMKDEQRPFFRLAVQQAEAAYNIRATHPLFYYWTPDPVQEINSYRDDGFKYFLLGVFTHFLFNMFCVACAVVGFSKIGRV
eukprot:gnl/MRDRNA2_/MRDRNA2_92470_c0_seq1.p1 gnl/MRDRNA2_/MRDRNA2_92470_c0~~gnl/MRDRNA2_/MRDRNA2_92470_c0_seq1.p1  ORF type:complete len:314 (+),score=41.08 gnl/MRDRNA2_/MRDRNA2_92470_c0_seq1:105-1046(+)